MAPFGWSAPPGLDPNGTLAGLMLRGPDAMAQAAIAIGQAKARAAEQSGQAWSGAIQNVGNTVAAIPQQLAQQKAAEQTNAIRQAQLNDIQSKQAGQQRLDALMQGGQPMPPGAEGPQAPSYLTADGLWDISKLNGALSQSGFAHAAPELLKGAEGINDSIQKHQQLELQAAQAHAVLLGDMADTTLKLAKASGMSIPDAMDTVIQPALATKRFSPQEYQQVKASISQLQPDQQAAALTSLMDSAAKLDKGENIAAGAEHVDRYNRVTVSNPKPLPVIEPGRAESKPIGLKMPDGSVQNTDAQFIPGKPGDPGRYMLDLGDGKGLQDVTSRVTGVKPVPKGLESKSVLLDGKPAEVIFNPEDGKYRDAQGADVSNRVKPIPPASMTVNPALIPSGDALDMAAKKYLASGELPSMGMGQAGAAARIAVMNRAAQIDPQASLAANKAIYKADSTNLTNLQKTEGTLSAFENTAGKNLDQFLTLAAKIPDTGVPWLNIPVRLLTQSIVGSDNMAAINAARDVALREIARVTNDPKLSGSLTDSARREIASLSPTNATLPQIKAVVNVLKQDMANVHAGLNQQIDQVKEGLGANPAAPPPASTTAPAPIKVGGFTVVVH